MTTVIEVCDMCLYIRYFFTQTYYELFVTKFFSVALSVPLRPTRDERKKNFFWNAIL